MNKEIEINDILNEELGVNNEKDFNIQESFNYSYDKSCTPIYELRHLELIKRKKDRYIDFSS